jgi:hypothetical protein
MERFIVFLSIISLLVGCDVSDDTSEIVRTIQEVKIELDAIRKKRNNMDSEIVVLSNSEIKSPTPATIRSSSKPSITDNKSAEEKRPTFKLEPPSFFDLRFNPGIEEQYKPTPITETISHGHVDPPNIFRSNSVKQYKINRQRWNVEEKNE